MNSTNITFIHKESRENLSVLIKEINEFSSQNSLIVCGLIDIRSNGNITLISNNELQSKTFDNEINSIFEKYNISKIEFSSSINTQLPIFQKIILFNDNI